jgi:serine/threonine protein phosphatase PrpC
LSEFDALSKLVTASLSDVGQSRSENQDTCATAENSLGEHLLVLSDGMGGHRGGAHASQMSVQILEGIFLETEETVDERLLRGVREANGEVYGVSLQDDDLSGMGATLIALALCPDATGWVVWAGDSRLYRLRDGELEQITEDHSLVSEWVELGVLSAEEAAKHPKRNELTRAIGVNRDLDAAIKPLDLRPGDRYLLCSDGLSGPVCDARIRELLLDAKPEQAVRSLVDAANAAGGPDNVTVQVAWLPEQDEVEESAPFLNLDELPLPELAATPRLAATPAPGDLDDTLQLTAEEPPRPREIVRTRTVVQKRASGLHAPSLLLGLVTGVLIAVALTSSMRQPRTTPASPEAPTSLVMPTPMPEPIPAPSETAEAAAVPGSPETPAIPPAPAESEAAAAPPADPESSPPEPAPALAPANSEPTPDATAEPAPASELDRPDVVVVGQRPASEDVEWIRVPEPTPTSAAFNLPSGLRDFLDTWLRALTENDHAAYTGLGFDESAADFVELQTGRESYRLESVEIAAPQGPGQTHLRLKLSWAFYAPGGRRFRTEDELRYILESTPAGLRYAGQWSD